MIAVASKREMTPEGLRRWVRRADIDGGSGRARRLLKWISGFATKNAAEDALVELLGKRRRGETIGPTSWIDGGALPDQIVAVQLTDPVIEQRIGIVVPDRDPLPTITRALLDAARRDL